MSPFFSFVFEGFAEPFCVGGIEDGDVVLLVEVGDKVEEVIGVLGLGLCRGEATTLVRWVRLLSCTGFDVAQEARRGEPSCDIFHLLLDRYHLDLYQRTSPQFKSPSPPRKAITITFFSSSKRRFHFVQSLLKQRPGQQRQSSFPKALVLNSCSHGFLGINGGICIILVNDVENDDDVTNLRNSMLQQA